MEQNLGYNLSPGFTNRKKPDIGFVSMEKTLSYLQAMNKTNAFQSSHLAVQQIQPRYVPPKMKTQSPKSRKSFNFQQKAQQDEALQRKQINKNRAIKRIIQTSMQILQKHYRGPPQIPNARSSTTQFHIYLKQYNRVLGRIFLKEESRQQQLVEVINKQQSVLEKVNNFVVFEDFRDILPCVFLKSKINKENIDMMMEAFKDSLIVLKNNQLRIHESEEPNSRFRTIKLAEIQNVDYHSQPYFFMIMTIVRDKSKPIEFLYFKMKSLAHQDKWDRALYCNYISRKMKNKHQLFLQDFPTQEETKKRQETMEKEKHDYQLTRRDVVKYVYGDLKRTLSEIAQEDHNDVHRIQNNEPRPHDPTNTIEKPIRGQQQVSIKSHPESNQIDNTRPVPNTERAHRKLSMFDDKILSNHSQTPQARTQIPSNFSKANRLNSTSGDQPIFFNEKQVVPSEKQSAVNYKQGNTAQHVANEPLAERSPKNSLSLKLNPIPMQIDKRKNIKQKYPQGFILKKNKLFGVKAKLVQLQQDRILYWDYDQKTKQKTQKKTILLKNISKVINNKKFIDIIHENSKEISLIGNQNIIKDFQEWILLNIQK